MVDRVEERQLQVLIKFMSLFLLTLDKNIQNI